MAAFWQCESPATEAIGSEALNHKELFGWRVGIRSPITKWTPPTAQRHVLKVLAVDDDEDTTDGLVRLIRRWGHAARLAYDGGIALQVACEQRPHVVLLDLQMPSMDGREFAGKLRRDLTAAECLIIAITGGTDEPGRRQCHEAGIDLVLIKPVDPSVIETLLLLESERINRLLGPAPGCLEQDDLSATSARATTLPSFIAVMKAGGRHAGPFKEDSRVRDGRGRGRARSLAQSHRAGSLRWQSEARF